MREMRCLMSVTLLLEQRGILGIFPWDRSLTAQMEQVKGRGVWTAMKRMRSVAEKSMLPSTIRMANPSSHRLVRESSLGCKMATRFYSCQCDGHHAISALVSTGAIATRSTAGQVECNVPGCQILSPKRRKRVVC